MMQLALWPFVFILLILCFFCGSGIFIKIVQPKQAFTFIVSYHRATRCLCNHRPPSPAGL